MSHASLRVRSFIGVMWGLCSKDGKEDGNYYVIMWYVLESYIGSELLSKFEGQRPLRCRPEARNPNSQSGPLMLDKVCKPSRLTSHRQEGLAACVTRIISNVGT